MTALSPSDRKLLRDILALGHAVEGRLAASAPALAEIAELRALIASCSLAEAPELQRLAFHERNLMPPFTGRHLAAILVPFERLNGRALRDDEFLITTQDSTGVRETVPLIVIAENLRSAFNVGAILRTAEGLGVERAILAGYTPLPSDEKTARTSLGAQESIPWSSVPRLEDAIDEARAAGFKIVALETAEHAQDADTFLWPERVALVVGNERFGLEANVLAKADHVVRIPLQGVKNSLNVGVAFGIAASHCCAFWRKAKAHAVQPIGHFHSSLQHPYEARRQPSVDTSGARGFIRLSRGQQFEQALEDLAGFERVWVIFGFDRNTNWKPKTLPPRGPLIKRGVFATRSPYRPNGLGLSALELVKVQGLEIEVRGFDLLDGTPIYDIKPYLPYADAFPEARAGWTDELDLAPCAVDFSAAAREELTWLSERGADQIVGFAQAQLEFDPLDGARKRVEPRGDHYVLSYRTWRLPFTLAGSKIEILGVESAYTDAELASDDDRYDDKELHRQFIARWRRRSP